MLDFTSWNKIKDKINEKDLGFIEDSITALLNLIHIEIHSINSYNSTGDISWLQINDEARKDRTDLLDLIVTTHEAQEWCFSKHTLAVILSFIELANRKYSEGKTDEAIKYFEKSKKWLGLFMVKNKL